MHEKDRKAFENLVDSSLLESARFLNIAWNLCGGVCGSCGSGNRGNFGVQWSCDG
jgi:hypothetical protein